MANTTQKPDQEDFNPAHNTGQDDFDKIIDKNFSPGDEKMMEERAGQSDADNLEDKEKEAAENDSFSKDSVKSLEQQESQTDASWKNNTSTKNTPSQSRFRMTRKRGAGLGLIGLFIGTGTIVNLLLGPSFGIVNLKEIMVKKYGGPWSSYIEERQKIGMARKMSKEIVKGCGLVKVKCRYRGMTEKEIKKFEKRNPGTIIHTEGSTVGGKKKIKSIEYYNGSGTKVTVEASGFKTALLDKGDPSLRNTIRNFNNPKVAPWRDFSSGFFYQIFEIARGKGKKIDEEKGKTEEERKKNRTREMVRNYVSGEDFSVGAGTSRNTANASEQSARNQVSDNINVEADKIKADFDDPTKAIDPLPNPDGSTIGDSAKGIAKVGLSGVKGAFLGPVAPVERACAAKRLISSVGYISKAINARNLIAYSMLFMVTADQIKAGDADGDTAERIGDLGSILSSQDPETKYTFADSFGYQYAAENKLVQNTKSHQIDTAQIYPYRLGSGLTGTLLAIADGINSMIPGGASTCKVVGNLFFQIGTGVLVIVSDLFTGGGVSAGGIAMGLAASTAFAFAEQIATPMLARSVAGAIITGDERGMAAGNAITSGFGMSTSMNNRMHGGFPLSKKQALAYDSYSDKINQSVARDRGLQKILDPKDPESFTSRFAFSLSPYLQQPSVNSIAKLGISSLNPFASIPQVSAANQDQEYDLCGDEDYDKLDIAAGPFCDPKYGLDPWKLNDDNGDTYDPEKVIEYMCGTPIDSEAGCLPMAFIDDDGAPKGEYADWITECVQTDEPIAADGEDETPKECLDPEKTSDPLKYNMFRMYYFDTTIDDEHNDRDASNGSAASDSAGTAAPDKISMADLYESSEDIACADGSKDLGVQDGYHAGEKVKIRVCALDDVPETGELSDVSGSDGKLVVNSRVSAVVIKMVKDAKDDGVNPITGAEGFRSMKRQEYLASCGCTGGNPVAAPGTSNHQTGVAIDWNEPMNTWMRSNGEKYGFKWYGQGDPPHFSPDGH
ncbi:MAG: M15 family metallopeptidase [Candidatus Saccharibacteria bacterium]|nr:M15 family metallopeptidase [Candidatus Saccharibacteria bacterium]